MAVKNVQIALGTQANTFIIRAGELQCHCAVILAIKMCVFFVLNCTEFQLEMTIEIFLELATDQIIIEIYCGDQDINCLLNHLTILL